MDYMLYRYVTSLHPFNENFLKFNTQTSSMCIDKQIAIQKIYMSANKTTETLLKSDFKQSTQNTFNIGLEATMKYSLFRADNEKNF